MRSTWERVAKLKLKPHQKIDLIGTYILPHYLYKLLQANISTTALKSIDRELKVKFKEIQHLPHTTCEGFLYTRKKEGGLELPNLQTIVISSKLRSGLRLLNNTDEGLAAAARASNFSTDLGKIATLTRIQRRTCRPMSKIGNNILLQH